MRGKPSVGTTVKDSKTGDIGRVMGHVGGYVQLRPLNGGKEWDAETANLEYAHQSDALSGAVAEVNARSAGRV